METLIRGTKGHFRTQSGKCIEASAGLVAEPMFDGILKRLDILKSTQNLPIAVSVPKAKITLVGPSWDTVKDMNSIANPTANNQNSTANVEIYENLQYA